jgi:hypothetical protein
VVALFAFNGGFLLPERLRTHNAAPALAFVGSEACADCHQAETALWKESQHRHAMQHATSASVLGDFGNATFEYYGVDSGFFKKDNKFLVETDGPDGKLATFEVKYTFGIDPLQQYLIEFPDGRIQAPSIAWDSRPKDQGGQRWFHLYPNEEILSQSSRGVRIRAVSVLAVVPTASQPLTDRAAFERAAAEFIAAQRLNADRPEARATLGNFYARRGLTGEAENEYKHSSGRMEDSMKVLKANLAQHPDDRDTMLALVTFSRDAGDISAALEYAEQLSRLRPNDRDLTRLTNDLRSRLKQ